MHRRFAPVVILILIVSGSGAAVWGQSIELDPKLQPYKSAGGVSGNLDSIGSDTLNNLMTLWAEGFRKAYPNVRIQVEGKGSSTAPPSLIQGTAQIGPMSRPMKPSEIDEFERTFGYEPTQIRVAIDALAVYVNKDNPLEKLSLEEVDAIFSSTLKCGHDQPVNNWDDVGLEGRWAGRPISVYGRNSASGTYGYFKTVALCKGDYRSTVKEQPGSASVVQGVTEDLFGIGYSGIGYKTSGVRALSLAKKTGDEYFSTDVENVITGKYPLARFLYVYVNKAPNRPLDPLVGEFLRFVLSADGQQTVVKDGYIPISSAVAEQERVKID